VTIAEPLRGQSLVVNLPATPVRLFGDFARLAQVLLQRPRKEPE